MAARPHLPSVVGCVIGFAAAGCGVGSLLGTVAHPWFFPPLADGQGTTHEQAMAVYGGTFRGMAIGAAVGAVAGAVYALRERSRRLGRSD